MRPSALLALASTPCLALSEEVVGNATARGRYGELFGGLRQQALVVNICGLALPGASLFYGLQAASLILLWLFVWCSGGGDFCRHAFQCSVAVRPSWLPRRLLVFLHRHEVYLPICYSVPPALALASVLHDSRGLRLLAALLVSAYQLAESSVTVSHRDYLMLYNSWGLALLPDDLALGLALGLCVHFVASSGLAKLFIGGADWARPETMSSILRTYGQLSLGQGGPWSPTVNRLVRDHDAFARVGTLGTLLFECVAVPLAFALPSSSRIALGIGMLLMHVGIFVAQSAVIGVFFTPNIASYLLGFGADVPRGSPSWLLAVLLCCFSIGAVALRRRLLPEDWPMTPLALFGWSGRQWDLLQRLFVTGRTRLIMSSAPDCEPLGSFVVERTMRGGTSSELPPVYSAWEVCIGETTVQNEILEALDFSAMEQPTWDATSFVRSFEDWLAGAQRMIVVRTGQPLVRAYFVELAEDGTVCKILARGARPERCPLLSEPKV